MARTNIPITTVDRNSFQPFVGNAISMTTADATNDMEFVHSNELFVVMNNESASPVVYTFKAVEDPVNQRTQDLVVTVPAGDATPEFRVAGPFSAEAFKQSDGKVYVDIDASTDGRIAAIRAQIGV